MSEEKIMGEENNVVDENLPAFVKAAPELLPVWDWWVKEGKSTLTMLLVVAVAVAGFYAWKNYQTKTTNAANQALVNAFSPDELETAVADYGSTKVGPALRIRLAKAYYDGGKYQEALEVYDVLNKSSSNAAFADVSQVGRAYALEGLEKYKEAQEAFASFAQSNTNSYLLLTAQLGAARCKMLQGGKDEAVKDLEALKAASKDEFAKVRIDNAIDVMKRYDPKRAAASLFDVANDIGKAVEAEKKPEAAAKPAAAPAKK